MAGQAIAERELTLANFDFDLPPELIAQHPLADRSASRLLHVTPPALHDLHFTDLERLLGPDDMLVFNDTRVIKARLLGRKPSGGKVEALVERVVEPSLALALVRTSHRPAIGATFIFDETVLATVEGRKDDFFVLRFDGDVLSILDRHGHVPLPPYISHTDSPLDAERYQTVYAKRPGAVAAPTAGLHFTPALLERLHAKGVQSTRLTLHVGAGTFHPVRTERLDDHRMHDEWYDVPRAAAAAINDARQSGRRIVAVGTTSLRALESAAIDADHVRASAGETALFIRPGFRFRVVDRLITNFHLPRSTLLMLVSAFAGSDHIRSAYAHAITSRYRFFSYGDAMLLERASRTP
ncbi:MAG TPA: tRNA preQ1(34) S-adenosylmethionine ribosyltransferase-isomerase QueA [Burkholderiaceae bacterium]|nr:tRNA preQ1(34) S-adenosylmethionine ribosyltransferase-isomerase QueA [Burkholderiaceae bacterium]